MTDDQTHRLIHAVLALVFVVFWLGAKLSGGSLEQGVACVAIAANAWAALARKK